MGTGKAEAEVILATKEAVDCVDTNMTFSTRPSTYRISLAPTGRARCRKCKQAIRKGGVRLEIGAFVRPGRYTLLVRCASCIDSAISKAILNVYTSASRVPAEPSVDPASAACVRDRITMCSKRVVGAATKTLEGESCPRTSCQP